MPDIPFISNVGLYKSKLIDLFDGFYAPVVAIVAASGNAPADDPHSRIHQGVFYSASEIVAALADDASFDMIITTPADDWPHVAPLPSLDGSADFLIYEAPTFTGGTAVASINHNRNSSNTFGGTVVHTPSVTAVGSPILISHHLAGGTGPMASGVGGGQFEREFILKASTSYLFRLTNKSGLVQRGGTILSFYSAPLIGA